MKLSPIIPTLLLILSATSCSLIFEEDISDSLVIVLTPVDGLVTEDQDLLFWWDHVDYSIDYNLQIVEGDFKNPIDLILDSVIVENKFSLKIQPGNYEWRISAMNYNSATEYTTRTLTILDTTKKATITEILLLTDYE